MELQQINTDAFTASIKLQKVSNSRSKSILTNNNYDLDLQNIQHTIRDNQDETFSFRIYQDATATFQQNIVVDCKVNKTPQTYLITYYLNKPLNQINNNIDFAQSIKNSKVVKIDNILKTSKNDTGGCLTVEVYDHEVDFCEGENGRANDPSCYEKDGKTPKKIQVYKIVAASCSTAGSSGFTPIGGQWSNNSPAGNSTNPEAIGNSDGVSIGEESNNLNIFVPNYFVSYDLSDPAVQNRLQINQFINDLYLANSSTKNIIDTTEWLIGYTNYWIASNGGLITANKNALTYALTKLPIVVDQFIPTTYTLESLAAFKLTSYQFLLKHGQKLAQQDLQTQQNILRICTNFENIEFVNETIQYQINNNWSSESAVIANSLRTAKFENPNLNYDIEASIKSPFNIDLSAINDATTEGAKFNEVYNALTKSPEFKKLFIDLFNDNNRFNVKFEIAEHLYKDNDPAKKEVNGKTYFDGTPNLIIKINKQILSSTGSIPKVDIEIAKTILHECIHAYLSIKGGHINAGMDIAGVINFEYNTKNGQHDFMYKNMLPIMSKILAEIRDLVTYQAGRSEVESLIMIPTKTPLTREKWIWSNFYKFISINGLDETTFFTNDFPQDSDSYNFYTQYNTYGHEHLNKK